MQYSSKIEWQLKVSVWAYILLVMFEGGLRKWVLPGLSDALLIIRDPIAIFVLLMARTKGYLSFNPYSFWMVLIGILSIFTAVAIGHGNFWVALYGARIFIVHFPFMFLMGKIFTEEDVIEVGRALLWIALPMTVLIILQFYSPQSAWVNLGVGGDTSGAGFSGALGYYRPPATFSFTNGTSLFYGLVAAFVFYFWFNTFLINKFLLIAATFCLILSIPFSISRTLLFEVALSCVFMVVAVWHRPNYLRKIIAAGIIVGAALFFLRDQSFFATGTEALTARFEQASTSEGDIDEVLSNRILAGMVFAVQNAPNLPFFGLGVGMGTNVGAVLLTGSATFLIAEEEWGRVMGELGLLMGFIVVIIRVVFSFSTLKRSVVELRDKNPLPWMLMSFSFMQILQAQWGQPTILGFSVIAGGLVLAAFNIPENDEEEVEAAEEATEETGALFSEPVES